MEHTGDGYLPKIVLCLVGDSAFARAAQALLTAESVEHEMRERDERMLRAFEASAFRVDPSLTAKDLEAIERHESVVHALSPNYGAGAAASEARRMLELGGRLLEAGAAGMKCECPPKRFHSGHTFRCDTESPRYVVRWEPCDGYDEDDFFFNPFGRYRFEAEAR